MRSTYFLFFVGFLLACNKKEPQSPIVPILENKLPVPTFQNPGYFGNRLNIPADNPITEKGVILGRWLFYDKSLSADNTISCGSCHQQSKGFTDGKKQAVGIRGQTVLFNTMGLHNQAWVMRHFWNGRAATLEQLTLEVIENPAEMDMPLPQLVEKLKAIPMYPALFQQAFGTSDITPQRIAQAISQFVRTMVASNSKFDKYKKGQATFTEQEKLGEQLFFQHPFPEQGIRGANCGDCHLGISTAGSQLNFNGFHNNGLDENPAQGLMQVTGLAADKGKFRAPSLRNIAVTAPYMHDGRFATLRQVIDHYDLHIRTSTTLDPLIIEASNELLFPGDPIQLHLTETEKEALLAFLQTLTDSTLLTNPAWSNPFEAK